MHSPQANLSPMWEPVHGQKRVDLPALTVLMGVLCEIGISTDLEMVGTGVRGGYESWDSAIEQLRRDFTWTQIRSRTVGCSRRRASSSWRHRTAWW